MSLIARAGIILVDFWLIIPILFGLISTKFIEYLAIQNAFLKEWDPTIKVICWAISAAIAYGIITKNHSSTLHSQQQQSYTKIYVGPHDLNLRSCPGVNCPLISSISRTSELYFLNMRQNYIEQTGSQTPWIKVQHISGFICRPGNTDKNNQCINWEPSQNQIGWVNETFTRSNK
jgi:hypothetical protein